MGKAGGISGRNPSAGARRIPRRQKQARLSHAPSALRSRRAYDRALRYELLGSVFFFQAEDGIRDLTVTGVQTCALPICIDTMNRTKSVTIILLGTFQEISLLQRIRPHSQSLPSDRLLSWMHYRPCDEKIGRASCRERV